MIEQLAAIGKHLAFALGMACIIVPSFALLGDEPWVGSTEEMYGMLFLGFLLLSLVYNPWEVL